MAFKKYEKNTRSKTPTITLTASGSIGINAAALEKFFKDAKGVELHFDPEEELIGIKPYKNFSDHMYSLPDIEDGNRKSASLSSGGFIKHFGINIEETQRFSPFWDTREKLVVISLREPITTESVYNTSPKEHKNKTKDGGVRL